MTNISLVPPLNMASLSGMFDIRSNDAVAEFLRLNPCAYGKLLEARSCIDAVWGNGTHVSLELSESPDGAAYDALIGYVQTTDSVDAAMAKLSKFADAWRISVAQEVRGRLLFDVEWADGV